MRRASGIHAILARVDTPLGVVLHRLAQAAPGRPAIPCDGITRSRAELDTRTNRLARASAAPGGTRAPPVPIGLPNGNRVYEPPPPPWEPRAPPRPPPA